MPSHFNNLSFYIPDIAQQKILDIGAGKGKFLVEAALVGAQAFGLEKNQVYIQQSLARALENKVTIDLVQGEAENMPFSEDSFDFINLSEVIEHVNHPDLVLKELFRVLKPGGKIYISVPSRFSFYDTHYHLYLVNWLPRAWSEGFIKFFGKTKDYQNQDAGVQKLSDMHYYTLGAFKSFAEHFGFVAEDMREIKIKKLIKNKFLLYFFLLFYKLFRNFYFKAHHFLLSK